MAAENVSTFKLTSARNVLTVNSTGKRGERFDNGFVGGTLGVRGPRAQLKKTPTFSQYRFEKRFGDWMKRRHKRVISNGDYFEAEDTDVGE